MMRFNFITLVSILVSGNLSLATNKCADVFYQVIIANTTKSIASLAELKLSLDLAQAQGKKSVDMTALQADYKNKEKQLSAYLEDMNIMTRAELLTRIKLVISDLQIIRNKNSSKEEQDREELQRLIKEQNNDIKTYSIDGKNAIFYPVKPEYSPHLIQSFEMMATPVTQILWIKVIELAYRSTSEARDISKTPSANLGELNPLEFASQKTVLKWIAVLNLMSERGIDLKEFIPQHKKGDVYRLPTNAEWEFVLRKGSESVGLSDLEANKSRWTDYAWIFANSDGKTHPVAQKLPIKIEKWEFYDMHGNVSEWVDNELIPVSQRDPRNPNTYIIMHESSKNSTLLDFDSTSNAMSSTAGYSHVGFRLVREVRP